MSKKLTARRKKEQAGRQCAVLPLAVRDGEKQVMLVTSRGTRRWVLPKGWEEPGSTAYEQAAREAFEEAGLVGQVEPEPIARYSYTKHLRHGRTVQCEVSVFPLWVERQLESWPEQGQRETRWFSFTDAALAVTEAPLVTLFLRLAAPMP
jgi:8-oxo-dGTP pyrophosphatase MutT (NUDIX family)